ncbi:Protein kinase domain [Dillenia turbinata]|uniref:Protein kinase domain n=1 Tax=Dillenia turbinata TaxID=194707 RepID=A0AAN8W636_9MAGN
MRQIIDNIVDTAIVLKCNYHNADDAAGDQSKPSSSSPCQEPVEEPDTIPLPGRLYACRSISKSNLVTEVAEKHLKMEIEIMRHLSGQPKVVEFKKAYADEGKRCTMIKLEVLVASEVLQQRYGKEIDIWGAGVILYILLKTKIGIYEAILRGHIDFGSDPWQYISASAEDLVQKMLTQDPKRRITSAEVLGMEFPRLEDANYQLIQTTGQELIKPSLLFQ